MKMKVVTSDKCRYCGGQGMVDVEVRGALGTTSYSTCCAHTPRRGASSSNMAPISQRRALGEWGMWLRGIAGM